MKHIDQLSRRAFMVGTLAAGGTLPLAAAAQDFPSRPVRIIVPTAAGGQPDIVCRLLAPHLGTQLGQPVVVENILGSGGIPAIMNLLRSPADGHTLLIADASHWAINPLLHKKLPYDPAKDLAPVRQVTTTSLVFVTSAALPATTLKEVVALAKAEPGKLNYASTGVGSIHHLMMEAFKAALDLDIVHVPYRGSGQSLPALIGGQVSMLLTSLASVAPFTKEGRVRILGVTTRHRSPYAAQIPSMAEAAGIADYDYPGGASLVARSGTPPALIEKLAAAIGKAINAPELVARFQAMGIEHIAASTPQALDQLIHSDIAKYARMAKIAGIAAE